MYDAGSNPTVVMPRCVVSEIPVGNVGASSRLYVEVWGQVYCMGGQRSKNSCRMKHAGTQIYKNEGGGIYCGHRI